MLERHMFDKLFSLRIHPKAWLFIRWGLITSLLFFVFSYGLLCFFSFLITLSIALFFRDPPRSIINEKNVLLSPADGVIMEILHQNPPEELEVSEIFQQNWTKIGIFLAPWHPHIQRFPCTGTILRKVYREGSFAHVARTETCLSNERLGIVLSTPTNHGVACIQIAGFLARRIICDPQVGDTLNQGDRYGVICFGSRVDLYIPSSVKLFIKEGQRLIAGESFIGILPEKTEIPHSEGDSKNSEEVFPIY